MGKLTFKTLRENVTDEIRTKILNGELTPGMRVIEQNLSEELGVSRGPIREALRELEQEGMIEYVRNAGCSVKKITPDDMYEIYLLRSTYENMAVKLCEGVFSDEDIRQMEDILEQMKNLKKGDLTSVIYFDRMFHQVIVEKSQLSRLIDAWSKLNYGSIASLYHSGAEHEIVAARQYTVHKKIFDSCVSGDVEMICDDISNHYMRSVTRLLREEGIYENHFKTRIV